MAYLSDASLSVNNSSSGNNAPGNETEDAEEDPVILSFPMIVLLACISLLIVLANCLVIFLMYKKKTLRSLTNVFLASLAFSDLISGMVGIPLVVICSKTNNLNICVSSTIFFRFTAISSVCHVLLVAFDRYVAIVHTLRQESLVTKRRAISAIIFVWMLSFVASVVQLSWYGLDEKSLANQEGAEESDAAYTKICLALFFAVPLILMCYIYGHIFYISFKLARRDRQLNAALQQEDRSVSILHHEWRGRSVLLIMVVVFASCWLPFFLAVLGDHIQLSHSEAWAHRLMVVFSYVPPLLNPLLCTLAKKDFGQALREMFFKKNHLQLHRDREQHQHFTTEV